MAWRKFLTVSITKYDGRYARFCDGKIYRLTNSSLKRILQKVHDGTLGQYQYFEYCVAGEFFCHNLQWYEMDDKS